MIDKLLGELRGCWPCWNGYRSSLRISHDHVVDECGLVTLTYSLVKIDAYCPSGSDDIQLLRVEARVTTNWGKYYNLGQPSLQNGTAITSSVEIYNKLG